MKSLVSWGAVFFVLLGFAYLIDHGETKFGLPVFFWLALNLTVFLYLLARYVGTPIGAFLETRSEGIALELKQAKEKLVQAETMKTDVLERLDRVELEVSSIRKKAEEQGRKEAEKIAAQAVEEEQRFLKRVTEEITRRQEETRQVLIQDTSDLTAKMARDILQANMTDADRKRVLDQSLDALRAVEGRT